MTNLLLLWKNGIATWQQWAKRYSGSRKSFFDDVSLGQSSSVTCVEVHGHTDGTIRENRQISIDGTESEISISHKKSSARTSEYFILIECITFGRFNQMLFDRKLGCLRNKIHSNVRLFMSWLAA